MTDIVERLRQMATASADEAADEIKHLRALVADRRMAMESEHTRLTAAEAENAQARKVVEAARAYFASVDARDHKQILLAETQLCLALCAHDALHPGKPS